MSENEVRDGLREAVSGEPPLDFNPDALVDTARKQVRRRALLSVGVATVAVVAAAVAVPLALSGAGAGESGGVRVADQPTAPGQVAPASPTSPVAGLADIEWPPPGTEPVTYTATELQGRANEMRVHLVAVLPTLLPGATDVEVGLFGGEAEGSVADDQNYLNAFASFTLDGARYGLAVNVHAPGMSSESPAELCDRSTCLDGGAVDDGHVVINSEDLEEARIVSAHHFRDSGTTVVVNGYNYDPTSQTGPVYQPAVPVGADLLTALATDPQFGL
jgi:hypothetical protein